MKRTIATIALLLLAAVGVAVPLTAGATVRYVEDFSGSTDTEKIQAAVDACSPDSGDVLVFGTDCEDLVCKPTTYTVARWDSGESEAVSVQLMHGVTYLGNGSTIKLADRPGGVDWADWRSVRQFETGLHDDDDFSSGPYSRPTAFVAFHFDGNKSGQDYEYGVDAESKQRGLLANAPDLTSGRQDVWVIDCTFSDHTWGGLSVKHDVDLYAAGIRTSGNHHGIQIIGTTWAAAIYDLIGTGDTKTIKVEPAPQPVPSGVDLAVTNATITGASGHSIEWGTATGDNSLTLSNVDVTCPDDECLYVNQYDCAIDISDSSFTGDSGELAVQLRYQGESATFTDTTITGYVQLNGRMENTWVQASDAVTFDGVTWSGGGYLTGSYGDFAVYSTVSDDRVVKFEDSDPGADNDALLLLRGGYAYIDTATIAECTVDEDEVIRMWCTVDDPCTTYWRQGETNPGSDYSESSQWCGADPASGDCDW